MNDGTGEITSQESVYQETRSAAEDSYWKCYSLQSMEALRDVSFGIIDAVMKRMSYAGKGQMLHQDATTKQERAAEQGVSKRMVERGVKALVDCGAVRRLRRCQYQVNPYCFGKGTWPSIINLREQYQTE